MGIAQLLRDEKFNLFFSFVLGVGMICLFRPSDCKGSECSINKPPTEKDFDQYVYRLGGKCYQFASETVTCPASGAVEAFGACATSTKSPVIRHDQFARRQPMI